MAGFMGKVMGSRKLTSLAVPIAGRKWHLWGCPKKAALEEGYQIKVGRFPFLANGKAIALGDEDGMIKTIFDAKTGELLGAHMIGPEVTELIQGYVVAKKLETTEEDLMQTIFPHPTLSEAMHESVLDAFDKAIHF